MEVKQEPLEPVDTDCCEDHGDTADSYCFGDEPDYLKYNEDYQQLLKVLAILEAQKVQAHQDLEAVVLKEKEALADPLAFVASLQRGEGVNVPLRIQPQQLPSIDWTRYSGARDFLTRPRWQRDGSEDAKHYPSTSADTEDNQVVVRGRVKSEEKPASFNRLWTLEEQKRLEDLLVKYPSEEVEASRYRKIAKALGNRTKQQVASRVQKFFARLAKAGLPVPGRMPSTHVINPRIAKKSHIRRKGAPKKGRLGHKYSQFLHSYHPPVRMLESEGFSGESPSDATDLDRREPANETDFTFEEPKDDNECERSETPMSDFLKEADSSAMLSDVSDDEEVPENLRHTPEYRQLLALKRLRKQALSQVGNANQTESSTAQGPSNSSQTLDLTRLLSGTGGQSQASDDFRYLFPDSDNDDS